MKEFYTIGEVSRIFNIPAPTLRYYDSIGLLTPWETGENGYRYYSKAQFEIISMIIFMRSIGTPVKRLSSILNQQNANGVQEELYRCEESIYEKIKELERLKKKIIIYNRNIQETCYSTDITLEMLPKMYMMSKSFGEKDELDIEEILNSTKVSGTWSDTAGIISTITEENLLKGSFHNYERYGYLSEIPFTRKNKYTKTLPAGLYVCSGMKINTVEHFEADDAYKKMMEDIEKNNLQIRGPAIERNVLDLYCNDKKNPTMYFRIYIPVKK